MGLQYWSEMQGRCSAPPGWCGEPPAQPRYRRRRQTTERKASSWSSEMAASKSPCTSTTWGGREDGVQSVVGAGECQWEVKKRPSAHAAAHDSRQLAASLQVQGRGPEAPTSKPVARASRSISCSVYWRCRGHRRGGAGTYCTLNRWMRNALLSLLQQAAPASCPAPRGLPPAAPPPPRCLPGRRRHSRTAPRCGAAPAVAAGGRF